MKAKLKNTIVVIGILATWTILFPIERCDCMDKRQTQTTIELPQVKLDEEPSVGKAMLKRRSVRSYSNESVTLFEISQLLWAAQGVTHQRGFRTSPSAGALYPLELYIVVGKVTNLDAGIYKYTPNQHRLIKIIEGDKRPELCRAALNQSSVKNAPVVIVFCAVYQRTIVKYGERGIRYVFMEVGHSAQNVYLQAVALGIGTVTIGAFNDRKVKKVVKCALNEEPLYIMPVGKLKN
jgi:SagB-type dehydrogenase family enzyme